MIKLLLTTTIAMFVLSGNAFAQSAEWIKYQKTMQDLKNKLDMCKTAECKMDIQGQIHSHREKDERRLWAAEKKRLSDQNKAYRYQISMIKNKLARDSDFRSFETLRGDLLAKYDRDIDKHKDLDKKIKYNEQKIAQSKNPQEVAKLRNKNALYEDQKAALEKKLEGDSEYQKFLTLRKNLVSKYYIDLVNVKDYRKKIAANNQLLTGKVKATTERRR